MIVLEKRPELEVGSGDAGELCVEPADIWFEDLDRDRVRIQVTVRNTGVGRSRPTLMRLESAPLGAFVPWQPLTVLTVPALEPGESQELSTEVARPHPASLGDVNRVPPKRLLTAVNSPDQPSPARGGGLVTMLSLLGRKQSTRPGAGTTATKGSSLAPDLWELMGRGQPHWSGNINVFVGHHAVERHLAKALRIYPGRANLAMFMVGGPRKPDAYAFELVGLSHDWQAALHDVTYSRTLLANPLDRQIQPREWVESAAGLMVMLITHPPAGCRTGDVQVHVTRRSCRKTAVVEFNLDPAAQGTGCYFV